ncbi:hypothetical protein SMD11_4341 [Streptomyces albireticuli]|uniref:HTH merR-type domain-containing protein n=1 Tax=Streptomyces albireticuli TaxID=1940 RepID=A0A1Z2L6L0_9ACTN|nr:MerR family DNA-binding transcriptional regulator [Streptomyces albireticuli]ARZ69947.1 hypothetical protein SMD11_4341 [Streptomyces albireticuli]
MRIGDLARRAGVTTKAVRYYESLGLITPGRLANGYRDYAEGDVRLVREIRNLGQLGIPVERTRPFLECLAAGGEHGDDCPSSMAGYREAIDDLTRRIDGLAARREALVAQLRTSAYRNSIATCDGGGPMDRTNGVNGVNGGHGVNGAHERLPAGLPVPEDDGAADHLPGLVLPPLELAATDGSTVRLDRLGPGRTVLYLYPLTGRPDVDLPEGWDAIPGARGCTPEACGFRDHHQELLEAGAERVFGLSSQDSAYQGEVVARLGLPFSMLSDPGLGVAGALGVPTFSAGGVELFRRLTMVVRGGRVEHVFYPVFPPDEHAGQVVEWLRGRG